MAFVDEARVFVKAGDGGKGCESFYREKHFRYPRPDGGDGGKGGDIVFLADTHIHTLLDFKFRQHFKAKKGGHGSSKGKTGRTAEDYVLKVPVGTILRDHDTGHFLRDLVNPGDSVVVARGGLGGKGNQNKQTPMPPQLGEERTVHLELKLIADVGLIGFPNAGKSTLVSQISKVRSKIANYPFTTKQPILGVVKGEDDFDFVVADLPGLIEGAHTGRGLGDKFLKHAERTKILVHVIDMGAEECRDPIEDYQKIENELKSYSDLLSDKERIVVANKMDVPQAQENLERFKKEFSGKIFEISALNRDNIDILVEEMRRILLNSKETENTHDEEASSEN